MADQNVRWLRPYVIKRDDGGIYIGIDTLAHYAVDKDKAEGYNVDNQLVWLAVTFANKLLEYALAPEHERQAKEVVSSAKPAAQG